MLLKELFRFSTQNRTFYCYLILTLWIFLLVAGMYKYIGNTRHSLGNIFSYSLATENSGDSSIIGNLQKFEKYKATCSPIHQIIRGEDGGILEGWKLQGLILVIRHGDRGPMSHVRNIRNIDCGVAGDPLVNRYRSFLYNSTSSSGSNHMYWNKVGPFHGFALLPATDKNCFLGQLTYKGIGQQLHIGEILHQIYAHSLGLLSRGTSGNKAFTSSTPHSLLNSDEVVLYATRYRRTFQSALALLYTFLPTDKWLSLNIKESHSMAFCFTDCTCSQADVLRKQTRLFYDKALALKTKISHVMQDIGTILLEHIPNGFNLGEIVDAILILLCNDAPLPCRQYGPVNNSLQNIAVDSTVNYKSTNNDFVDTINIDQDEQNLGNAKKSVVANKIEETESKTQHEFSAPVQKSCIEPNHVETLMNYALQESANEANHFQYKRIGLLRAYGMIRHIVSYMLKMISGDRTKLVLYSGHSRTLQYLTAALGIKTDTTYIPYAARLAIEVYKSEAHTDYYFRVVYNGHDVTQQIDFCEGGKSLRVTRDSRGNKADLCPIENIIRFLHEDYFASLNSTNFKESCTTSSYK